jgi:glutaredoxin 2
MMMKLYVYEHCPFCVKARTIFGLRKLPFEMIVLLNDDEETPKRLIGRKMTPILEDGARFMPESMDIVAHVDAKAGEAPLAAAPDAAVEAWLKDMASPLYALAMPRWAASVFPEFATAEARAYFTRNKEAVVGSFDELLAKTPQLLRQVEVKLAALAPLIRSPNAVHGELSLDDIHLYAALRALSIVRGVDYPPAVEAYRQAMSRRTAVPLHDSIAL